MVSNIFQMYKLYINECCEWIKNLLFDEIINLQSYFTKISNIIDQNKRYRVHRKVGKHSIGHIGASWTIWYTRVPTYIKVS